MAWVSAAVVAFPAVKVDLARSQRMAVS